jgi:hypothetical protein
VALTVEQVEGSKANSSPPSASCANCGSLRETPYCGHCGQSERGGCPDDLGGRKFLSLTVVFGTVANGHIDDRFGHSGRRRFCFGIDGSGVVGITADRAIRNSGEGWLI